MKMPEPITAPTPQEARLQGPSVLRSRLSGSSEAAISASILRVLNRLPKQLLCLNQRLRWPCVDLRIFFFSDPRATVAARLALGAAFLRAARFRALRSSGFSTVFV